MSYKSKKPDELRESDTLFFHAEDISEPTIVVRWGDLKEHLRNELLSSFPERKDDAPASIDPEFLKPAPKFALPDKGIPQPRLYRVDFDCCKPHISPKFCTKESYRCLAYSEDDAEMAAKAYCHDIGWTYNFAYGIVDVSEEARKEKEESDKPKNAKSTYKVEFVCLNSCKEGEMKSHTCTACSEEEAIEETKRHCKVIQCDYRMAIGIWKDGLWYSAGDLAVQKPQKEKYPSPFNTYLVKYEYKTHSAVSTDVHAEEFVAIAADKMDAVNKLMKHLGMLNRHFHRLRSVEKLEDVACISGEGITMPYSRLTDEQIVAAIDHELNMNARNDTLATDRIERLASRIEFYGRTDEVFAEKHRYWQARVAYLRHGDFPNPGIDRNGKTFTAILKECADMIRPPQEKGEPIPVNAED